MLRLFFEICAKQQQDKNTKFGERVYALGGPSVTRSTHPLPVRSLQKLESHALYQILWGKRLLFGFIFSLSLIITFFVCLVFLITISLFLL